MKSKKQIEDELAGVYETLDITCDDKKYFPETHALMKGWKQALKWVLEDK